MLPVSPAATSSRGSPPRRRESGGAGGPGHLPAVAAPGTPTRISLAAKIHKSLSSSLGLGPQIIHDDIAGNLKNVKECLHQITVDIMILPHDAAAPFTADIRSGLWIEKCMLGLERLNTDPVPTNNVSTDSEDSLKNVAVRPFALVTALDRKVSHGAKRRISEDTFPPAIIHLDEIVAIHPVVEDIMSTAGQSVTFAVVIEAVISTRSMFFSAHRHLKQCLRFVFREDMVEWVASLKAAITLAHCPRDELPCLHHVFIPAHQRVVSQQHALLVLKPSAPRPLGFQLLQPLTMAPLYEISLDNVTTVGQRLDDKQLWVTFKSDPNGMVVDLSLKCKCVAELVKTLKAALQLNLDWGEELTSDYTSTVVCHKRSHTSVGSPPTLSTSTLHRLAPAMPTVYVTPPQSSSLLDDRSRMPTPAVNSAIMGSASSCTTVDPLAPQKCSIPPERPPKPGTEEPQRDWEAMEDDFGEMTEMKGTLQEFADLPDSVYPPLHPEMSRSVNLSGSSKFCTLPVSKSRSQSSGLLDNDENSITTVARSLQRSSSVPSRGFMKPRVARLSNRARLLPQDNLDLDEVSLLSDYHLVSTNKSLEKSQDLASEVVERTQRVSTSTLYVVPPMAVESPPEINNSSHPLKNDS